MTTEPTLIQVYREAYSILNDYKLTEKGWTFDFSNELNTLGRCDHNLREIRFSKHYLHIDPFEITDTLRHEVAHALVGPSHGHDDLWKQVAVGVGARPIRCAPAGITHEKKPNYVIKCGNPNCDRKWYRHRLRRERMKGAVCPDCHTEVQAFRIVRS